MSSSQQTLASLCTVKQGRYLSPSEMSAIPTADKSIPVIGGNGVLGYTDKASHSVDVALVTCRGSQCGLIQWVPAPLWVSNNAMACDTGSLNRNKFVRYLLSSNSFEDVITGSAQPQITMGHLTKKTFDVCSENQWNDIVSVLGGLDDRITLLRETNATLEAIAQALFKSWFVDFDPVRAKLEGRAPEGMDEATARLFPDGFEESELGLVPRGWRIGTLEDCCSRVESGGTPKRTTPEYWDGDVSWLTSGEVRNPIVFDTKEKITALGVKESSAKLWPSGTTVVAMYGATAGEVCLLAQPTTANQACCGLIPSDNFRAFLFFCTRKERENLASKSSGSAQQNLNKGLVCCHQVLIPSVSVASAYENVAGALLESWIENEKQAQTLATLRDTLLPRLISGQLRLPQAQAASEKALA